MWSTRSLEGAKLSTGYCSWSYTKRGKRKVLEWGVKLPEAAESGFQVHRPKSTIQSCSWH